MAWSAILFKLPEGATLEDVPNDYRPHKIGTSEEIYEAFQSLFPCHSHKLGQTRYVDETCYVEFNYQDDGMADSIGIRSDAGPAALSVMKAVCISFGLSLFDYQAGELVDLESDNQDFAADYREWINRQPSNGS